MEPLLDARHYFSNGVVLTYFWLPTARKPIWPVVFEVLTSAPEVLINLGQQGIVLGYSFLKNVLSGNLLEAIAHSWQHTEFCEAVPLYRKWDASPHPTGLWETCTSKVIMVVSERHGKKKTLPAFSCSKTKEALHRSRPCAGHSKGIKAMQRHC